MKRKKGAELGRMFAEYTQIFTYHDNVQVNKTLIFGIKFTFHCT